MDDKDVDEARKKFLSKFYMHLEKVSINVEEFLFELNAKSLMKDPEVKICIETFLNFGKRLQHELEKVGKG